jgi:Mg-chelatase subunit ChlD
MPEVQWNPKRQIGELTNQLRGMPMGNTVMLPHNIKIGAIAVGRRGASKQRQFAVVHDGRRDMKRSATEAASLAMDLHSKAAASAEGMDRFD